MEERYSRNMPALSPEECAILHTKHVGVIGCGGLGGYIIEILARIGIGTLTVADGDVFDATNLNRQLLSDETLLGVSKAEAAKAHVAKINSDVTVTAFSEAFTTENGLRLLEGCDLVVDALDSATSRLALADVCAGRGLTIVHGAIAGWHGQVAVVPPGSDLLKKLYPPGKTTTQKTGNPPFTPAVCAAIEAAETVKLLIGRPSSLQGQMLLINLQTMEFLKVNI